MKLVVDTNVLVSGTFSPKGTPGRLLALMVEGAFTPVISSAIFSEYHDVMYREKFGFDAIAVATLLETILLQGELLMPPVSTVPLPDPKDRPFLDAALTAICPLITGNAKHFPPETGVEILSPAEALARL